MVTVKQLVDRAVADVSSQSPRGGLVDRDLVERVIHSAIHGIGFHIAETTGEVCDPRPKPVASFPNNVQHQNGVRWRGGRRR